MLEVRPEGRGAGRVGWDAPEGLGVDSPSALSDQSARRGDVPLTLCYDVPSGAAWGGSGRICAVCKVGSDDDVGLLDIAVFPRAFGE